MSGALEAPCQIAGLAMAVFGQRDAVRIEGLPPALDRLSAWRNTQTRFIWGHWRNALPVTRLEG